MRAGSQWNTVPMPDIRSKGCRYKEATEQGVRRGEERTNERKKLKGRRK